jgi:hypothetical protein
MFAAPQVDPTTFLLTARKIRNTILRCPLYPVFAAVAVGDFAAMPDVTRAEGWRESSPTPGLEPGVIGASAT